MQPHQSMLKIIIDIGTTCIINWIKTYMSQFYSLSLLYLLRTYFPKNQFYSIENNTTIFTLITPVLNY